MGCLALNPGWLWLGCFDMWMWCHVSMVSTCGLAVWLWVKTFSFKAHAMLINSPCGNTLMTTLRLNSNNPTITFWVKLEHTKPVRLGFKHLDPISPNDITIQDLAPQGKTPSHWRNPKAKVQDILNHIKNKLENEHHPIPYDFDKEEATTGANTKASIYFRV